MGSRNSQTTPAKISTTSVRQLLGATDTQTALCHIQRSPGTPTTRLRECGNNTSKSTGRSGQQKPATRRNMRREKRVTVQGPVKKQQPDRMSHRGWGGVKNVGEMTPPLFWGRKSRIVWFFFDFGSQLHRVCVCAVGRSETKWAECAEAIYAVFSHCYYVGSFWRPYVLRGTHFKGCNWGCCDSTHELGYIRMFFTSLQHCPAKPFPTNSQLLLCFSSNKKRPKVQLCCHSGTVLY